MTSIMIAVVMTMSTLMMRIFILNGDSYVDDIDDNADYCGEKMCQ